MALATQCPHCHTTFRVAHDQLKLRAGLVRCGACKQIFNGIENLLRPEELEQVSRTGPATRTVLEQAIPQTVPRNVISENSPAETKTDAASPLALQTETPAEETTTPEPTLPSEPPPEQEASSDPLLRMTLMDFAHERHTSSNAENTAPLVDAVDPLEKTIDALQSKPWRNEADEDAADNTDELDRAESAEYEEPAFVKQGRRRQRLRRSLRLLMAFGSVVLLIGLAAQGGYVFRNELAAWLPQAKPILTRACTYIACQVGLPEQIDTVSLESSELQAIATDANTFTLTALLRNHGATVQAWPHIELTLNDTNGKPLARRVFLPQNYVGSVQDAQNGFAPQSEQPIKLHFELAQLKASGYRVYLFYP